MKNKVRFHKPFADIQERDKIKKRDVMILSVIFNNRENVIILLKEELKEDTNHTNWSCICKYVCLLLVLTV